MKFNFNIVPKLPNGDESDISLNEVLSTALLKDSAKKEDDVYKFFEWGMRLGKGDIISLDKADQKKMKDFIVNSSLTVFVKGALLEALESPYVENDRTKDQ